MTRRLYRTAQCYRCGYVWRLRRRVPRICARCKSPRYALPKLHIATYGSGLGIEEIIGEKRREVLRRVRKFGGRGAQVFGSVARREAGQASDVDMLVGPVRRTPYACSTCRWRSRTYSEGRSTWSRKTHCFGWSSHRFSRRPYPSDERIPGGQGPPLRGS